ncbi:MAG TPA: hypothetical protein PLN36_07180 [Bacteroidales bacterium]|nr:hypothetical protein [Bacteroidales bacterium]
MKESTIYEFDPAIYPRKVWVAVTDDTESLKNYFSFDANEIVCQIVNIQYFECLTIKVCCIHE